MVSFAYSTILGWSYYGNRCVTYLFGAKAQLPYQVFYVIIGFLGAVGIGDAVCSFPTLAMRLWPFQTSSWCSRFPALSHARLSTISTMAILMKCAKTKFP